jgi:hypothetical protein
MTAAAEVGAEVLHVRLPARAVAREVFDRDAALLDDEAGAIAGGGERRLDLGLVRRVWRHHEQQSFRSAADLDPARPLPTAGEAGMDSAPDAQVAADHSDPSGEPLRVGERGPHVVDAGVVHILHPHRTAAVADRGDGSDESGPRLRVGHRALRWRLPRAISVCSAPIRCSQSAR